MAQSSDSFGNLLFEVPVKVRRGQDCKMPAHLGGAVVCCYAAATSVEAAVRLAVQKLSTDGYVFEDIVNGKVNQLDPQKWDDHIAAVWPELPDYFPPQAEMLRFVAAGGVLFGPFCSWERKL